MFYVYSWCTKSSSTNDISILSFHVQAYGISLSLSLLQICRAILPRTLMQTRLRRAGGENLARHLIKIPAHIEKIAS